jgi:hypothetical protein
MNDTEFRPVRWRMAEGSIMELSKATCPHRKYPLEFYDEGEWLFRCCGMVLVEKVAK